MEIEWQEKIFLIFNTELFILRVFDGEYCYLFPIRNLPSCAEPTLLIQEVRGMRQNKETYHVICWRKRITLLRFCLEGPLLKEGRTPKISVTSVCLRRKYGYVTCVTIFCHQRNIGNGRHTWLIHSRCYTKKA